MKKKTLSLFLALTLLVSLLSGCGEQKPRVKPEDMVQQSAVGFYFDTVVNMTIFWPDDEPLQKAKERCAYYENLLSKTVEGSDVWNINHAGGARVKVSEDTLDLLKKSIDYSEKTNGAFDVTVEPCVALWDFTGDNKGKLPDADALAAAAAKVDYTKIDINSDGVQLPAGMSIDLGAIAKGYITDRIADYLEELGVISGILNFGGNVQTIGTKLDGSNWRVGVQDPAGRSQESIAVVEVGASAVVTSGIYERGFDLDGVRYHHILDTATGWPVQNDLAGVSIIVPDSFDGDALSTSVFALGLEGGTKLIESMEGVEAIFVTREDKVSYTSGLEGKIQFLK